MRGLGGRGARLAWALAFAAFCCVAVPAFAAEQGNLDAGHPLRFEDPYPVPRGEWSVEVGGGPSHFEDQGKLLSIQKSHLRLPVEISYGAVLNAQVSVAMEWFTRRYPDSLPGSKSIESGDLRVSALYNFNQETTTMPALGLKYTLELPTGTRSEGVDAELKALLTKSISRLSFHLNVTELLVGQRPFGSRSSRSGFDLGASLPLGRELRHLLLAGWHSEQDAYKGAESLHGFGVGIRRQQSARTVLDLGVETRNESWGKNAITIDISAGLSWSY